MSDFGFSLNEKYIKKILFQFATVLLLLECVGKLKLLCDAEFFRLTRRKREGVVSYVERTATLSDGKITVTVKQHQQPLMFAGFFMRNEVSNLLNATSSDGKFFERVNRLVKGVEVLE